MASYSKEFKEKLLVRMLPPNNESISKIAIETQITEPTLRNWRNKARRSGIATPANAQVAERWNSEDKFLIVLETDKTLNSESISQLEQDYIKALV